MRRNKICFDPYFYPPFLQGLFTDIKCIGGITLNMSEKIVHLFG